MFLDAFWKPKRFVYQQKESPKSRSTPSSLEDGLKKHQLPPEEEAAIREGKAVYEKEMQKLALLRIPELKDFPDRLKNPQYLKVLFDLEQKGIFNFDYAYDRKKTIEHFTVEKALNKKYVDNLQKLHGAGIRITEFVLKSFDLAKGTNDDYVRILLELKVLGIEVELVIEYFDVEKSKSQKFVANVKKLHAAGIPYEDIAYSFGLKEGENENYIQALLWLKDHGLTRDNYGWGLELAAVEREGKLNIAYLEGIKKLHGAGVSIKEMLSGLTAEKGQDPRYIEGLIELHHAGISIKWELVYELSLEQGRDPDYRAALIELQQNGFDFSIEERLTRFLTLEKAKNAAYRKGLIALKKSGVLYVDNLIQEFSLERGSDSVQIAAIIDLAQAGIPFYSFDLKDFTPEKAKSKLYREAVKFLHKHDIRVHWENLTLEKARNKKYLEGLRELKEAGIEVTEIVSDLTLEQGVSRDYRKSLIDLHRAGVRIVIPQDERIATLEYGTFVTNNNFSLEKAKNKRYMANFLRLQAARVKVGRNGFAKQLTLEKGLDAQYVSALMELQGVGIDVAESRFDGEEGFVTQFTLEKASDPEYREALKQLHASGISVDASIVQRFSIEKAKDQDYLKALVVFHNTVQPVSGEFLYYLGSAIKDAAFREAFKIFLGMLAQGDDFVNPMIILPLIPEQIKDPAYREGYARLIKAGIGSRFSGGVNVSFEIGRNPKCIDRLISLSEFGLDQYDISDLGDENMMERLTNDVYFTALRELRSGGIKIDTYFIRALTLEKATDRVYLATLADFKKAGLEITSSTINELSLEAVRDARYIQKYKEFMQRGEPAHKAIFAYLEEFSALQGITVDYVQAENLPLAFQRFYAAKKSKTLTPFAERIVDSLLKQGALWLVHRMNESHNQSLEKRRELLKGIPLEGLYHLVVYGVEELFTSSFRGVLFPLIMAEMQKQGMDAADFIDFADPSKKDFRIFLQMCSKYGKLREFVQTIKDSKKKKHFLRGFIEGLEVKNDGLRNAIAVAEAIQYLSDDKALVSELEGYLRKAYEGATGEEKILYGFIGSIHEYQAKTNKEFFRSLNETYPIQPMEGTPPQELVNKNNEIIQQYFFYNDEDGQASFDHFLATYQSDRTWTLQEFESYILFQKKNPKTGVTILKFANKPTAEKGFDAIQEAMKKKDLSTIQVVHRGHSYHAGITLERIPAHARIVYLGSCGGFGNVQITLHKAPQAHIISTKGEGTMSINDPLLKLLDEIMLAGKGISWDDAWREATRRFGSDPRWGDYVNPSKNTAAHFVAAYTSSKK